MRTSAKDGERRSREQQHSAVMVVGCTGHLGVAVVEELRARKIPVVAVVRPGTSSPHISTWNDVPDVTVRYVDASSRTPGNYAAVIEESSPVAASLSCLSAGADSDRENDFLAIDRDATIRWGTESLRAGVKHILLVATFEGRESRATSAFSAAKEDAVRALREACAGTDALFTVLRPNAYFKDLTDGAFERVLADNQHTVLGDGTHKINPIAREDVAQYIVNCIQHKRGGEFFLGGPDIFTFKDIGVLASDIIHRGNLHALHIRCISLWWLRALAVALSCIGQVSRNARRKAAFLHWMIFCSTHDAVAPCCGTRHLRDEYERKLTQVKAENESHHGKIISPIAWNLLDAALTAIAIAAILWHYVRYS